MLAWLRRKFDHWLTRNFSLRYHPVMIERRGYWLFVDYYGDVYRLTPTCDRRNPIQITLAD